MNANEAYGQLALRSSECALLSSTGSALSWDQQTYMPEKGLAHRSEQMAYLAGFSHRLWTAPETGEWLSCCEQHGWPEGSPEAVNLRRWRKSYNRATRIPTKLVEAFEKESALGHEAWVKARKASDFSLFQSSLEKIVDMNREMAELWGYEGWAYNALLEAYETGAKAEAIKTLFDGLAPGIGSVLGRIRSANPEKPVLPAGPYPVEQQQLFNRKVAEALGFDFTAGRIDTTAHPFCTTLGPGDVRLTTRYDVADFTSSLYGIIHETGHGLYEQGLDPEQYGRPMGEAISLGIHESQSRLWENQVCRRPEFWERWFPVACECFPQLRQSSPEAIARYVNHVEPSFIRVEADEVTYDLHVILRFGIEVDLFQGEFGVADIPAVWNERFEKMIGLKVPDDARGCLQDVHWSMGSFGYFATYTLGSLNAAQLFARAGQELEGLEASLTGGGYAPLLGWLRTKIHRHGQAFDPQDLMKQATGRGTDPANFLEHLRRKADWLCG